MMFISYWCKHCCGQFSNTCALEYIRNIILLKLYCTILSGHLSSIAFPLSGEAAFWFEAMPAVWVQNDCSD